MKRLQEHELSSVGWLIDHHQAKEQDRRQMVNDFGLGPRDRVLDSACGPGLWSRLFAESVFPDGRVVAVDFSPGLIEYAWSSLRDDPFGEVVHLVQGDFNSLPFNGEAFDVVFLGNCFCYFEDVPTILKEHKHVTRTGGRVISKEFDGGAVIFHPIDPALTLKVLAAAAENLAEGGDHLRFDNFIGRKMHGMFLQAGFESVSTQSYAIQKLAPLAPSTKRYIKANADWCGRMADTRLSNEECYRWAEAFDPASEEHILDREDFYFSTLETVTVGTV